MRPLAFVVVVVLIGVAAGPPLRDARAEPGQQGDTDNQKRAKVLWQQGIEKINAADDPSDSRIDTAIAKFKEAYDNYPYVDLLQALAQAFRAKNDNRRAVIYFKRYLNEYRRVYRADPGDQAGVEALISELEQVAVKQESSALTPPTEAKGPAIEPNETAATTVREPGVEPVLTESASAPGPLLERSPVGLPTRSPQPRWYEDRVAWLATAVGVLGLGTGAGFVYSAHQKRDELQSASEWQRIQLRQEADRHERIGVLAAVGGGVAAVAGLAMLVYNPERRAPRLQVSAGASSISVGVRVAF